MTLEASFITRVKNEVFQSWIHGSGVSEWLNGVQYQSFSNGSILHWENYAAD